MVDGIDKLEPNVAVEDVAVEGFFARTRRFLKKAWKNPLPPDGVKMINLMKIGDNCRRLFNLLTNCYLHSNYLSSLHLLKVDIHPSLI